MHFNMKNILKNNHNYTPNRLFYYFFIFFSGLFYYARIPKNSSNEEEWKQRKTKSKAHKQL
jgi:hypothetical protein